MSPEALLHILNISKLNAESSYASDWWSLGVITFLMLYGELPFQRVSWKLLSSKFPSLLGGNLNNLAATHEAVFGQLSLNLMQIGVEIDCESAFDAHEMISGLLKVQSKERMSGDFSDAEMLNSRVGALQRLRFFKAFLWNDIDNNSVQPPYVPEAILNAARANQTIIKKVVAHNSLLSCATKLLDLNGLADAVNVAPSLDKYLAQFGKASWLPKEAANAPGKRLSIKRHKVLQKSQWK